MNGLTAKTGLACGYCGRKRSVARQYCSKECSAAVNRAMPVGLKFRKRSEWEEKLRKDLLVSRPVTTFKEMSPEKQEEMRRLYERSD